MQASGSYAPGAISPTASLRVSEHHGSGAASISVPNAFTIGHSGVACSQSFWPAGVSTQGSVTAPSGPLVAQSRSVQGVSTQGSVTAPSGPLVAQSRSVQAEQKVGLRDESLVARLQAEVEQLRREAATRDEVMADSAKELHETRESRAQLQHELESLRAETHRMSSELSLVRMARDQIESAAAASQAELEDVRASRGRLTPGLPRDRTASGSSTPSRLGSRPPVVRQGTRERSPSVNVPRTSEQSSNIGPRRASKDEIDGRLLDFLDRSDCSIAFRRMNRGWYVFKRNDEGGPDRCVELSLVNNKLMAQVEVQTHEKGWNNGRPGAIERFVAHFAA